MARTIQEPGARQEEGKAGDQARPGVSKLKLAVGAASLFLFIVGVKRSFHTVGAIGEEQQPEGERQQREQALR